ncbi:hypothetical protein O1611_g3003 [Lasiodiplodia mahajangana]|uniref:Uncharacterized protein n=1 Tax=Lasiodiplodia mahajangana TaxID=1108764 RepID=A0ACC2JSZ9_9PEZI|nr:hypothetical protein O1611_g3003 [Lasiodiplodia mahajangana]
MVALRSRRFLRCFYCGQRSNIQFEAQKSFVCSNCDATNWLDQNGEITDPPTAADSPKRNRLQYATPRPSAYRSPSPVDPAAVNATDDSVFCATCLRNQQMLSSSLAQFEWLDDATISEQRARERRYWELRKSLEKRYPQVCEKCLSKVNEKLHQASYIAQTDHLRRMMDRTRSQRTGVKTRGLLDVLDFLGKLGWYTAFALQAVWHVTVVSFLLMESYASARDGHWLPVAFGDFYRMGAPLLPYADRIMQWSIHVGMCSFPWNPRFKQSIRGFTAHILGFRQWYTYQLLILMMRFIALSITQYSKSHKLPATTQLGLQLVIPLIMVYIYLTAKETIHTDTAPLFRRPAELTADLHNDVDSRSPTKDSKDLGNILDDILHSPPGQQDQTAQIPPRQSTSFTSAVGRRAPALGESRGSAASISRITGGTKQPPQEQPPAVSDDDAMDWTPSGSQHRAFSSYNPYKIKNTNPRFSDLPIEPKPGPIWYKVPPAPTNPAQRLRNPPMRPIIRESPKEKKETFFKSTGRQPIDLGNRAPESSAELNLAPPKFYALEAKDDPRDSLSSMFATSFNISPDPDEREEGNLRRKGNLPNKVPNRALTRIFELIPLIAALCTWMFAMDPEEQYGRSVAVASVCVSLMVSIRLAADLEVDYEIRGDKRPSVFAPCLANLALAQVITTMVLIWNIWSGSTSLTSKVYGNTVFGSTIIHHVWHVYASFSAAEET